MGDHTASPGRSHTDGNDPRASRRFDSANLGRAEARKSGKNKAPVFWIFFVFSALPLFFTS